MDADVIVVGGGPAGASTAWHLARSGVATTLVDRARFPRDKPCAEYLSPEASRILEAMGAMPAIDAARPARLNGMIVRSPGGYAMRGDFSGAHGYRGHAPHGLALPRRTLDAIVLDRARAAGVNVVEGAKVLDVERDANGAASGVALEHDGRTPTRLTARFVIGADGLRSVVARRLGLSRTAAWPRRVALVAHYRGVAGMSDCGEMLVRREGYLGLAPVGHGLVNVALVVPASLARHWRGRVEPLLDEWLRNDPRLAPRFADARRVDEIRATGPFASKARRATAPGAALVGDAADFFDPFTGEGIYAALLGGEMLAPFVVESLRATGGAAATRALSGYEDERRVAFGGKWMVERLVGLAVAWPALLDRVTRSLAARKDMADLFIGVTGDFVPAREVLRPGFLARLLATRPRHPAGTAQKPATAI